VRAVLVIASTAGCLYSTRLSILVPGLQPWNALHWRLLPPVTISRGRSLGTRTAIRTAWSIILRSTCHLSHSKLCSTRRACCV